MRGEVRLTTYQGRVTIGPRGGAGAPVPATVEPGELSLSIVPEGGEPVELAYADIDDLFDDDYTMRLTDWRERRYDLSMFGKAYGQILAEVTKRRRDRLQHDLLLTGVGSSKAYAAFVFGGVEGPVPAELRLFDDLLVVIPERGLMWGLPYSFIEGVEWDAELYQIRVTDDLGEQHLFGRLAKRSEEFRNDLKGKMDALARRTAATLATLVPGLEPAVLSRLAGAMRDGRAVQQRAVDAIDPALWARLERVVVGTPELQGTYDALNAMTPPGWAAFGVKAVLTEERSDLPDVHFGEAGDSGPAATDRESHTAYSDRTQAVQQALRQGAFPSGQGMMPGLGGGGFGRSGTGVDPAQLQNLVQAAVRGAVRQQGGPAATGSPMPEGGRQPDAVHPEGSDQQEEQPTRLWYFCPLVTDGRPINAVAQEVTSEPGHATYVFRLMEPERFGSLSGDALAEEAGAAVARLNRALLTLNFRREPIYLPDEEIEQGRYTRYKVAVRKLDYLKWTRQSFLGRAIHKDEATWRSQLDQAIARA